VHPKAVGDRTTLAVISVLQACGFAVLVPFGENTRYDLAIDDGSGLARVQCKTGRLREGGVRFAVCSCYGHHLNPKNARRDYHGDVDYFGVYCPETTGVYLIPIEDLQVKALAILRVTPSRNNQKHGIRMAAAYEIGQVAISTSATEELAGRAGAGAPCA
jgi:hypothetical protein